MNCWQWWTLSPASRTLPPVYQFLRVTTPCSPWALYCEKSIFCFLVFSLSYFDGNGMGRICDNRNVHCAIHEDSMGCKRNVWKEDLVSGTVLVFMGRLSNIFNAYLHSLFFCTRLNFNYICLLLSVLCDRYIELLWYWRQYVPLLELFLPLCMLESGLRYCYCNIVRNLKIVRRERLRVRAFLNT